MIVAFLPLALTPIQLLRCAMSVLLETHWGDVVVDLVDLEVNNHPNPLSKNFLKLAKARQYTQNLVYRIDRISCEAAQGDGDLEEVTIARTGCPRGNGRGGASLEAYLQAAAAITTAKSSSLKDNEGGRRANKATANDAATEELEHIVEASPLRFLKSSSAFRRRCCVPAHRLTRGDVVALCVDDIPDTIGSQFGIVLAAASERNAVEGSDDDDYQGANSDGEPSFSLLGRVVEDDGRVLDKLASALLDDPTAAEAIHRHHRGGSSIISSSHQLRPLADIRIQRVLVLVDPFDDPPGLEELMKLRGVVLQDESRVDNNKEKDGDSREGCYRRVVESSPSPDRPVTEIVPERIPIGEVEAEMDEAKFREQQEQALRREDKGRAIVLEMLGDLPDADIKAPENVLFICKLNPVTQDEDLELIFSRFDPGVRVDIIRDPETGASLQYAFAEFANPQRAAEAYFKMNHALVDDRRIKVDFSQSVATIWDKYRQRMRRRNPRSTSSRRGIGGGDTSDTHLPSTDYSGMPKPGPDGSFRSKANKYPPRRTNETRHDEDRPPYDRSRLNEAPSRDRRDGRRRGDGGGADRLFDPRERPDDRRLGDARVDTASSSRRRDDERDEFGRLREWSASSPRGRSPCHEEDEIVSCRRSYREDGRRLDSRDQHRQNQSPSGDRRGEREVHRNRWHRSDDPRGRRNGDDRGWDRDRRSDGRDRGRADDSYEDHSCSREDRYRRHRDPSETGSANRNGRGEAQSSSDDDRSNRDHQKHKKDKKRKRRKKHKHRQTHEDDRSDRGAQKERVRKKDRKHSRHEYNDYNDSRSIDSSSSSREHKKHRDRDHKRRRRHMSRSRSRS
jgi:peptidyl-prolyl cis-trans isomerase-like 4